MKAPRWNRSKKAVKALREFLAKHMKSEDVKISKSLNEAVWVHGIKNPPHHVKINVTKNDKGEVYATVFGENAPKVEKKVKAPAPKVEEKKV